MGMTNFEVGKGNRVLAQISDAAAELLAEARDMGSLGAEFGGVFMRGIARELVDEGLGEIAFTCEHHGMNVSSCLVNCHPGDVSPLFLINDAGEAWLADSGR